MSEKEIVIGSCAALEGPSQFLGRETVSGAEAYFRLVNDDGGINGSKLKLVSFNDGYDPEKAQSCWDKLMQERPFALGFFVGTTTAVKYVPLAEKSQIPMVGLFTGAQTLYMPLRHWVDHCAGVVLRQDSGAGRWVVEGVALPEDRSHLPG